MNVFARRSPAVTGRQAGKAVPAFGRSILRAGQPVMPARKKKPGVCRARLRMRQGDQKLARTPRVRVSVLLLSRRTPPSIAQFVLKAYIRPKSPNTLPITPLPPLL